MRVPHQIIARRREQLRQLIRADGFLPVAEICRRIDISAATARRDLAAIAANGHITRTHGGALADYNAASTTHPRRTHRARSAKGRIAATALERCPFRGTVFLDAGTTVQAVARLLVRRRPLADLIVVTNSLPVASILGGTPGIEVRVLGGMFLHRQTELFGAQSIRALARWKFDTAFLGAEAFDARGIANSHAAIAAFQRVVLRQARLAYFCLDASKLGRTTPHRIVGWTNRVNLITDAAPAALTESAVPIAAERLIAAR